MLFEDTYRTINNPSEGVFRDRGSKFLAYAFPLGSELELKNILSKIKSEHPKARHYCWAIRMTTDRSVFRLNDDGEPAGTAGRPILNAMLSLDITDAALIVVRYFGGTLLGVPGLIHAYKTACIDALNNAEIVEKNITYSYLLEFDYLKLNDVMRVIKEEDLNISRQQLDNRCRMELIIAKKHHDQALERLGKLHDVSIKFLS